jgi:hypothetical protein
MGVTTKAYYPNITKSQIIEFLHIISKEVGKERPASGEDLKEYSSIVLEFNDKKRTIQMLDTIIDLEKDEAIYLKKYKELHSSTSWQYVKQDKLPDLTKGTLISLGYNDDAIQLFTIIAFLCGGYINERDTDDKPYYKVKKNHRALISYLFGENLK